ncbi:Poly-beta-1,6-N-acetyl-D-glucosamine N-deacetylase precursor [compost metagenome]
MKRLAWLKWTIVAISIFFISFVGAHAAEENSLYENQVAVIVYHHISDESGDVTITKKLLGKQLRDLSSRGYHFISLHQFKAFLGGAAVPPNAVLVTFDDGYRSFYTEAYPILSKRRIPAVNFVITKDLDQPLLALIPALSRDEIKQMTKETDGMDFQCHTDRLHNRTEQGGPLLTTKLMIGDQLETDENYNQRIKKDTNMCISRLRELYKGPVDTLAYPFGSFNLSSIKLLQDAGVSYGFTTISEMVTRDTNPMQIPRINAGSPFVQFNSLNNLIMQKIVTPLAPTDPVSLKNAVKQLGGTLTKSDDQLQIQFEGQIWKISKHGMEIKRDESSFLLLHEPLVYKNKEIYMQLQDLEAILGFQIVYNANTNQYFRRYTPKV